MELRGVGPEHGLVRRGGVLGRRGDGRVRRGGRLGRPGRRAGPREAVLPRGDGFGPVPARVVRRAEPGRERLGNRVRGFAAVPGVPDSRAPAAALPDLLGRAEERPAVRRVRILPVGAPGCGVDDRRLY